VFASDKGPSIQLLPFTESEATIRTAAPVWPLQVKPQTLGAQMPCEGTPNNGTKSAFGDGERRLGCEGTAYGVRFFL
jgi:hypothetical protein